MTGVALATRLDLSQYGLFTPSLTVGALLGGPERAYRPTPPQTLATLCNATAFMQ